MLGKRNTVGCNRASFISPQHTFRSLLTNPGDLALTCLPGYRCASQEPQPDWWYFGGRVKPGLTPEQGAANNVKRELGLDRPVSSFQVSTLMASVRIVPLIPFERVLPSRVIASSRCSFSDCVALTQVIANYSFVWKWRAQAPADHGTADISTIHNLELESEAEVG